LCEAQHYLSVTRERDTFAICYQRYTLRYPLEYYDDGEVPPIATLHAGRHAAGESDGETFAGPIVVYPRKRRFSRCEVEAIWRATKGRCHICSQRWPIAQRGPRGWHIDHMIPHIGGRREVEELPNFRVACARCNLKKGKGYTEASIRLGLRHVVELLAR
jgi:5-methylcytosine-specific restriction endonuclease McrA